MTRQFNAIVLLTSVLFLFSDCKKKEWDEFYGRPDNLESPIYQRLEELGRFKHLLAVIDRSGYKQTLSGGGYWTFFAPNDDAFNAFFTEKGLEGPQSLDSASARAMVQFLLVYNAYSKDRLDDYQATSQNAGWIENLAFRRRTAYYTGFYKDTTKDGRIISAVSANRNGSYVETDYNNKHITYFTDDYFSSNSLSEQDYKYFYPNSEFTGFNVAEARVLTKDLYAENGVVHEIDKVVTPLQSLDEYIRTKPEYSSFKAILNRLYANNTITFQYSASATERYRIVSRSNDSVFVKLYASNLAFSPNNENFLKQEDNDSQKDCWTMFIPRNEAVDAFVKNVLCEHYPSLDEMPANIIYAFLNAHLFPTAVWPTKFASTRNIFTEPARFDPYADVFEKKILSNGILYGTNKVQDADIFTTVYSKAYLNPQYSIMTRLLDFTGANLMVAKSNVPVNIFMVPDEAFQRAGYYYNINQSRFEYKATPTSSATTNNVNDNITRILNMLIFYDPYKSMIEDLSGTATVKPGAAGLENDLVQYSNNVVSTAGLRDVGRVALVDSVKVASNGKVFFLSELPLFSSKGVGAHIEELATDASSPFYNFYQYLLNSDIYNASTQTILGLSGFSTILAPTNEAIVAAVNEGLLPGTGTAPNKVPNFAPTADGDKQLVRKFLQYHILSGRSVIPDGQSSGMVETLLKNDQGTSLRVTVGGAVGTLTLTDNHNRASNIILPQSNNLSNRSVIHLLDNYLKYND